MPKTADHEKGDPRDQTKSTKSQNAKRTFTGEEIKDGSITPKWSLETDQGGKRQAKGGDKKGKS